MTLKIQVLACDRHKTVPWLNLLKGLQPNDIIKPVKGITTIYMT
jgi:hypothetical protein